MKSYFVSRKFLTSVYLIVPVCFLIIVIDQYINAGALRKILPFTPNDLFVFNIFFVLPHIIASSTTLADREYLIFYKKKLIIALLISSALAFVFPHLLNEGIVLVINGVVTIHHVLAQQFGVTATIAKVRSGLYSMWKWQGLTLGAIVYYLFYFHQRNSLELNTRLEVIVYVLSLLFAASSFYLAKQSSERLGKVYIGSNFFLILFSFYFIKAGYPFFAMLAPRVVHDLTAFSFYTVHDSNRQQAGKKNLFVKALLPFNHYPRLTFFFFTPLLGITLALFAKAYFILPVVNFLTLFHYATESFVWKSEGIHRQHIRFS